MLSTKTETYYWQYENQELSDPDLIDKLVLSLCDSCHIAYPHYRLHLLINELITNAIDHGVLCLDSGMKVSGAGFEKYLIERARRLKNPAIGSISLSAWWVGDSLLRVSVEDSGAGFESDNYSDISGIADDDRFLKLYGRGLIIVSDLCKSVVHLGHGNCTVVEFDVTAQ